MLTVFDRIARGDVFFYELTVPEGSNMFDIASSIDQFDFMKGADFLRVARDPSLIRDLAPDAPSLEGYLFPSTYRIDAQHHGQAAWPHDDGFVPQTLAGITGLGPIGCGECGGDVGFAG